MNILFALYHDFTANSASHVSSLANELVKLGHDCAVAVPDNKASIQNLGNVKFRAFEFEEALQVGCGFEDGRGPDVVHAWTPREIVRRFCQQMIDTHACQLFIHMEDNEWHILACALRQSFEQLTALPTAELDRLVSSALSHPHRAVDFLKQSCGITVIIDRLAELLPAGPPTLELWPSADKALFVPRPKQPLERKLLGVPKNSTVLVYTGNVHAANSHEMRSLYLAIAILNREGFPTTLIRAGRDFCSFLGEDERWGRQYSIELGMVPHKDIPNVLALADLFVQPGVADDFNNYRFPSKLPEFLSVGRPVILPDTNIAKHMVHRRHGFILAKSNAVTIAAAVREIMSDSGLADQLSAGALEFSAEYLGWDKSAAKLNAFYQSAPAVRLGSVNSDGLSRLAISV